MRDAFGHRMPVGRTPLLLHPQPPAAHRRLRETYGSVTLEDVWATPTASYRTVLAWRRRRRPVLLKLSLGARVGGQRRSLSEYYLVPGIIVSRLLETIPLARRRQLGFDWFPERAGVAETFSGNGWLLRHLPRMMTEPRAGDLVPVFSLIAPRGQRVPLLVDLIRTSELRPERYVTEKLLRPYVNVLAYLLFEEGIPVQGHAQNILVELDEHEGLTGRLVLRDLTDTAVSIALRVAKRKPLPSFGPNFFPRTTPFPLLHSATDYAGTTGRHRPLPGLDTVERYGLRAFVWSLNTSLARFFARYDAEVVEYRYLEMWQEQAIRHLGVEPLISDQPKGLATDEALAYFLSHVDWKSLGCSAGASLPRSAEPLSFGGRPRRHHGPVYQRVECAWGELFLEGGSPAFFRPAF
jgi:hypothetical protein